MTLLCTAPTLSKLRRWSYARRVMPPVTKGQSGQVHDDRSLSVPQLSASATADGFECYWKSDTIKYEVSHCRTDWIGRWPKTALKWCAMRMTSSCCAAADSVMGCFSKRPGDGDASSGAVS